MKKLNRKGFTLVELLAVIVILAIVVGIAIPGVTGVINGAKHQALETAIDTTLDFLQDQYDMYTLVGNNADPIFTNDIYDGSASREVTIAGTDAATKAKYKKLGFGEDNVASVTIKYVETVDDHTVKFCVKVNSLQSGSDYLSTEYWKNDGTLKDTDYATKMQKGSAC